MRMAFNRKRIVAALIAANLILIWGNSLLPGELSGKISACVTELIGRILGMPPSESLAGHGLLRKIAHFSEFACLGLLLTVLIRMLRSKVWERLFVPMIGGVTVAAIDEIIQIFVPGRGPHIRDVGIDSLGVLLGVCLVLLFTIKRRKKEGH